MFKDVFDFGFSPLLPLLRGEAGVKGLDDEGLAGGGFGGVEEAGAEGAVDGLLHGLVGAAVLHFEESHYVVVEGESGTHVMMLAGEASRRV